MKNYINILSIQKNPNAPVEILVSLNDEPMNLGVQPPARVLAALSLDGDEFMKKLSKGEKVVIDRKEQSLDNMIASTRYLADTYATKLEKKHIENMISNIYEHEEHSATTG